MTRKNIPRSEALGSIHFDARTNTVMAGASQANIKEKVQAVREVVPGKGNNEVHMVLQYYDYNVETAIQAYLEDGAKEALREWNFTGSRPNKKRKNKKKATGEKVNEKSASSLLSASMSQKDESSASGNSHLLNGHVSQAIHEPSTEAIVNKPSPTHTEDISGSTPLDVSPPATQAPTASVGASLPAGPLPQRQSHNRGRRNVDIHHSLQEQPVSGTQVSTQESSSTGEGRGKPQQGLEKAIKDLHRQTTSLERLRHLLDHEIDRSFRSVKTVFEELRQGLNDREAQLMTEMNVLKQEAWEMLEMRQNKAADFRRLVDRSDRLKDADISELRAEIKHFVSERRHDDDLGRTTRFVYDSDRVLDEIKKFGQVVHVKSLYTTTHSRSTSSVDSCGNKQVNNIASHDRLTSHSVDMNHLQNRLDNSLQIQRSAASPDSEKQPDSVQNDAISSNAASSSPPPALSAEINSNDKRGSYSNTSQSSYSFARGRYSGNSRGPRGRGRVQGDTGQSRGRGGFNVDRRRAQHDTQSSYQRPSHAGDGGSSSNKQV
ncbi:hypothetical protein BsWGS_25151 [Bradybaena similaris]